MRLGQLDKLLHSLPWVPSPKDALGAAVRSHDREKSKLEQRALRNTEKRDKAIRKAHAAGLTMREIAKIAGISHQRVAQVVKEN